MAGMAETPDLYGVRARSFGAVAAAYDTYRPRYPDQLVDDVVAMLPGRRVLEVGAGTGIATAAFAARGVAMTCVEPDPGMAALLTAKVADADVHVTTFEEWSSTGFDGLISAQAFHWTDPRTRWANAGAAVRTDGVIAVFWNDDRYADPRVGEAFTAAYDRRGIEIRSIQDPPEPDDGKLPQQWPDEHAEADRYFADMRTHRYRWTHRVPVADYVARVNTTSAHLILPAEVRDDMTAELVATLTGYGDEIELAMVTDLVTAVRR
jgi:SAM-dependent methyltransferase